VSNLPKPYVAFAVDYVGVALVRHDLIATSAKEAEEEARKLLVDHPLIEVWHDHRRIVRLKRE
jgi:hypothetical protein